MDNIICIKEATQGDGDVLLPGWYFIDEAGYEHGPFSTQEEAVAAMKVYADQL